MKINPKWINVMISLIVLVLVIFMFIYVQQRIEYIRTHPCEICRDLGYNCMRFYGGWSSGINTTIMEINLSDVRGENES